RDWSSDVCSSDLRNQSPPFLSRTTQTPRPDRRALRLWTAVPGSPFAAHQRCRLRPKHDPRAPGKRTQGPIRTYRSSSESRIGKIPGGRTACKVAVQRQGSPRRVLATRRAVGRARSEEHTSELQSRENLVCRLLLE